ncbi:competence/damage-inducible protein A [Thermogladius sp. 4427co]|uniref:competence/damage-inducible protein A n=1 Tax=Thermogladius sp. 4427co TaxID=3450718 RepID=UPI003F7AF4ED
MKVKASILVIGSEILKGITLDTNSNWLAKKLTDLGFEVVRVIVVPDSRGDIEWGVKTLLQFSDLVITTGGLGFTEDDITAESIASSIGSRLVFNEEAFRMIASRYGSEANKFIKASYLPENAKALPNDVGVSPGFIVKVGDKILVSLPGVPAEMKDMFEKYVEPLLQEMTGRVSVKAFVRTRHLVEAEVDRLISYLRRREGVYIKTHAEKPVRLTIIVYGRDVRDACGRLKGLIQEVSKSVIVEDIEMPRECVESAAAGI